MESVKHREQRNPDMKNSALTANIEKALASIFPVYGNIGIDVPSFDKDKHMYLVDQHQFDSGNRSLTYAAIAGNVVAEVVLGHFHGWEYMNKLRVLVLDGQDFKVVATKEWGQSTRMDMAALRETVSECLTDYAATNPATSGFSKEILKGRMKEMTRELFSQTEDFLDSQLGRQVLLAYCEANNTCRDLSKFIGC